MKRRDVEVGADPCTLQLDNQSTWWIHCSNWNQPTKHSNGGEDWCFAIELEAGEMERIRLYLEKVFYDFDLHS
jgi:hypothetical protein